MAKVLYILGNGFDINYGLKTRYVDFYPYLVENAEETNTIVDKIKDNYEKWSDYEEALGQSLSDVDSKNVVKFYADKDEVDLTLQKYLLELQKSVSASKVTEDSKEFVRSVLEFGIYLPPAFRDRYIGLLYQNTIGYSFVTLNYTNIVDRLIDQAKKNGADIKHNISGNVIRDEFANAVHVHGNLTRGMITGVNDSSQINNTSLLEDATFLNYLIKERMNDGIGDRKTETVSSLITGSNVIILFGVSIGNTDNNWRNRIIIWLLANENHLLFICKYSKNNENQELLPGRRLFEEGKEKDAFLGKKTDLSPIQIERLKKQIVVLFNPNLFRFNKGGTVMAN